MYSLAVIIPNYNNEKYIAQCLDSILRQTRLPDEIIVVDDCSTDLSKKIIEDYANKYQIIHPVFLETNGGVSNARNIGLHSTKCNYVTFVDGDDFYFDRFKLENEMSILEKYKKDVMVYSVTINVDETGDIIDNSSTNYFKKKEFISGRAKIWLVSMLKQSRVPRDYCIKKEIIEKVGAYSFYKNFYEDLDLLMRIAFDNIDFICTFKPGTSYRIKNFGLSHRNALEHKSTIEEITTKYYNLLNCFERIQYHLLILYSKLKSRIRKIILGG